VAHNVRRYEMAVLFIGPDGRASNHPALRATLFTKEGWAEGGFVPTRTGVALGY